MSYDFKGKKAIVTGASRGIGRATVVALCNQGVECWALARTKEDLDSLEKEVPNCHGVQVDVSDWTAAKKAAESIGPVDFLVNNAGVPSLDDFLDIKEEDFDRVYNTNVKAIIPISQVVIRSMIAQGKPGAIVNVSSLSSKGALHQHSVYCGTKAALDAMTKVMALELGPHKIRVNSVNPTVVMTDMGKMAWSDPAKSKPMLDRIPLGRFAEVEDVVDSILFLLSDKSSMIHGHSLPVGGGIRVH